MGASQSCCCEQDRDQSLVVPTQKASSQYSGFGENQDGDVPEIGSSKLEPAAGPKANERSGPLPPGALELTLDRSLQVNVGLNLDALDEETAFVDGIVPGAIETWNRTHPNSEQLSVYDRIYSVNGVKGQTEHILREMRQSLTWNMIVERPTETKIHIDCSKHPSLGLDLKYSPKGGSLLIASVGDGAIKGWNATASGTNRVGARDRIVEVNGVRGTARKLLETATNVATMDLVVLHYQGAQGV